ncbi:hypothetical protein HNY73_016585 [Argiope bruennichi]|uniref:Uncharacterized protein n=1 Tax=Argiope bruennichi TaxID=94029 RepID=A0A8T0EJ75_ARGBR|nr:hypothetical protein HNY73_016585 [Argiope bruennichi]
MHTDQWRRGMFMENFQRASKEVVCLNIIFRSSAVDTEKLHNRFMLWIITIIDLFNPNASPVNQGKSPDEHSPEESFDTV